MRLRRRALFCAAALLAAAPAHGWFTAGHRRIARAAVAAVPADLPRFFRAGAGAIAQAAGDPDLFKEIDDPAVAALRRAEQPEHYVDFERLEGRRLPPDRNAYHALLRDLGRKPAEVGSLGLAIAEWTQRLTLCFVEHRAAPGDGAIRAKCLVFAGELAHYGADLAQPLHTTIHHNGRARADGSSPGTGIHFAVDAIIQRSAFDERAALAGLRVEPFDELAAGIAAELADSHALVERIYELERPLMAESWQDRRVADLARGRFQASVRFVARLYATAWRTSARLELPDRVRRKRP